MLKYVTRFYIIRNLLVLVFVVFASNAHAQQTTALPADTLGQANTTRIINQQFNGIYQQNARLSMFGNEYGNKLPTSLVADLVGNFVVFSTPKSRFAFIFNPRVKLRLLNASGAPVKSPSYMPGGTLYMRLNSDAYKPSFLSLSYTHHSNGVKGPTLNADGSFNRDTGKFTTNFYTLTYTHGKRVDHLNAISNRYESIGVELHAALAGLGYAKALKNQYGFARLNGNFFYNLLRVGSDNVPADKRTFNNWMRLQLEFQYIMDKYSNYGFFDAQKRLNVAASYYYQFPFMQNVALMVGGGYRGQDDYNIFFQDSYAYFTVGLAAGVSFGFHQ